MAVETKGGSASLGVDSLTLSVFGDKARTNRRGSLLVAATTMLRRKKLAPNEARHEVLKGGGCSGEGEPLGCLSRRLLLTRVQSYQSSSVLTLDTSSASTNKEDCSNSSSSPAHDLVDSIVAPPLSIEVTSNKNHTGLNKPNERSRRRGSSLKVKTQEESLGASFRSDASCRSSSLSDHERKSISWCTVEFQTYDIILGDNPATSRGPPLSIGKVIDRSIISLADYEEHRPPRRSMSDLIVPHATRERLLMDAGYSRCDLHAMEEKLLRIKLARKANATASVFEKARNLLGKRNIRTIANQLSVDRK